MRLRGVILPYFIIVFMALMQAVQAQGPISAWTTPQPLNEKCCAAFPAPVVDPWGQMHLFWVDEDSFIVVYQAGRPGVVNAVGDCR